MGWSKKSTVERRGVYGVSNAIRRCSAVESRGKLKGPKKVKLSSEIRIALSEYASYVVIRFRDEVGGVWGMIR